MNHGTNFTHLINVTHLQPPSKSIYLCDPSCDPKGPVTRCNFSCNLQCNATLRRCKISKYKFPSQFASIFLTYQTFVTNLHQLRLENCVSSCKKNCTLWQGLKMLKKPKGLTFTFLRHFLTKKIPKRFSKTFFNDHS